MRIDDLPRPWLLAAMTGVSMSTLLEQAERERAQPADETSRSTVLGEHRPARPPGADQPVFHLPVRLIEHRRLAS